MVRRSICSRVWPFSASVRVTERQSESMIERERQRERERQSKGMIERERQRERERQSERDKVRVRAIKRINNLSIT